MRWSREMPQEYQSRRGEGFLWWPVTLSVQSNLMILETRWFEWAEWVEQYIDRSWKRIQWVENKGEERA